MLGKIILLMFISVSAFAETRTYLVYRQNNFPQDRYLYTISPQEFKAFMATGKTTITEADGQPFRMTSYKISSGGKYALWTVSFKDDSEKRSLDSMERQKYIVLLSSSEVVSEFLPQKGGYETAAIYNGELAELPTDYYMVGVSTQ